MNISHPLTPNEIPISPVIDEYSLNHAIQYLNSKIWAKDFHYQIIEVENYKAIILSPYGVFNSVMDRAVDVFKEAGWDCYWAAAYDGRGPHHCFYIHKKHFA